MKKLIFLFAAILFTCNISFASDQDKHFFVFLNSNPEKDKISEDSAQYLQNAHLANIDRLYKEGKIIAAGPFAGGGGLFVFKTKDIDECWKLLNSDPGIQAKRWKLEVFPMNIIKGDICKLGETYEMGTYSFVRFVKDPHDASLITIDLLNSEKRIDFLNKNENKIIIASTFGEKSGGFLIINAEEIAEAEKIMSKDPAVNGTKLLHSIKQLWIAKGTFCD